jgi:hypothetical protein
MSQLPLSICDTLAVAGPLHALPPNHLRILYEAMPRGYIEYKFRRNIVRKRRVDALPNVHQQFHRDEPLEILYD